MRHRRTRAELLLAVALAAALPACLYRYGEGEAKLTGELCDPECGPYILDAGFVAFDTFADSGRLNLYHQQGPPGETDLVTVAFPDVRAIVSGRSYGEADGISFHIRLPDRLPGSPDRFHVAGEGSTILFERFGLEAGTPIEGTIGLILVSRERPGSTGRLAGRFSLARRLARPGNKDEVRPWR